MPAYDAAHFDPPAPTATVSLRDPRGGPLVPGVVLLIDSGADATLLPASAVARLGVAASSGDPVELVGFDGSRSAVPVAGST